VKNIAILGAKIIGSTLGQKWARVGHSVMFAVRNINNPEVLDFAFPGDAMGETVQTCGPALNSKIVIDAANRMGGGEMNSTGSFATHAPGAHMFRAFNRLGWKNFEPPKFDNVIVYRVWRLKHHI
jgi:hypothetical protein